MKLQIISANRLPNDLRDLAVRRVQFALRRMTWLVPRASVHLSDTDGTRSGADKRCQIEFKTHRDGVVVVTAVAREWRQALDGALARATRTLLRLWRQSRGRRAPAPVRIPA